MITINPSIFRAYDIRGTALPTERQPNPDLTPETMELIGQATATYLQQTYQAQNMIVGRDNRLHSETLQKAFTNGVLKTGLNVIDAGLTTSPMIYFASCFYQTDSAINITASHNPKEENGLKVCQKNARTVSDQELQEILKLIQNNQLKTATTPGQLSENKNVFQDYKNKIISVTKLVRPLKIVIDAGNGIAGAYAPDIFRALGCEVVELYCDLDGNFPNHEANPEHSKNLVDLSKKVRETKADLGIGFDGDGDRIGVVDENGLHYSAEYLLMLLSRDLLKNSPGEKIIFDVKVCNSLITDIEKHGGQPIMSRVGHAFIKRRLIDEKATLAGEKSGHMFFGCRHYNYYGFDDAIFAAAKIVEALSKQPLSFSQIFADLPAYPNIPELKLYCPDDRKHTVINSLKEHFTKQYPCITLDGVRIKFEDSSWALARYSNTSPYLTLHAEAPTQERLEEIKQVLFDRIKQHPEVILPL